MKCSFCGSQDNIDEETNLCSVCWSALEGGEVPPINFIDYFSSGLEKKLMDVDSILFNLPDNFFLWYLKGHLEHELGESKKAMRSINSSISYKDDFGDSRIRLGLIYSDMHREADAIENFKKGLRYPLRDPSNLVDAGTSLQASDNPRLAAKVLQRALDLVPYDERAMVALAKVLFISGELDEAKGIMEEAIEKYPHNEEVLRAMAQIQMKMGDLESALDIYSRILDQHPSDFEALLAKGEILLKMGNLTMSLKAYKAVKDMDIHISWPGILKFIHTSLTDLLERNRNQASYRDDLKKEYENIKLYLSEIDGRIDSSKGPDILDELEGLVKVMENLRIFLKERMTQFNELLGRYKVEDSFHKHLESKVGDLEMFTSDRRYFDGKQISLELSPFLTDLDSMDTKTEARLRRRVEERSKEMEEIGLINKRIVGRMDRVRELEEKGNLEGALFLLKEVQVSLDEVWEDAGKKYFESKVDEVENLIEIGEGKFDTSRMKRKFKTFKQTFKLGPRAIREGYLELTKDYTEDSENYYVKEVERILRETQYKLVILEKDGSNIKKQESALKKLRRKLEKGEKAYTVHPDVVDLYDLVSKIEGDLKKSMTRKRLTDLDKILGDADALGLDEEIARNVEPVRRVIERSLDNDNHRLADILTGEIYENVEKLLHENYIEELEQIIYESQNEMDRLETLGVTNQEWIDLMKKAREIITPEGAGPDLIPVVEILSDLQTGLQDFYVEKLSDEIERNLKQIRGLIDEGAEHGFDLAWYGKALGEMESKCREISSLEILEETVSFKGELETKVVDLLKERIVNFSKEVREDVEKLGDYGATKNEMMDILTRVNRAEIQLESENERGAYITVKGARNILESKVEELNKRRIKEVTKHIKDIIKTSGKCGLDYEVIEREFNGINKKNRELPDILADLEKIHGKLKSSFKSDMMEINDDLESRARNLIDTVTELFSKEETDLINNRVAALEEAIRSEDLERIPVEIEDTKDIIERSSSKARKKSYLAQCSLLIEKAISLDNDKARGLAKELQTLAGSVEKDDLEGVDEEMDRLKKELSHLDSLIKMQDIEKMLSEIEDLDDLSSELFKEIKGEEFEEYMDSISNKIKGLIDSTPSLYNEPDPEMISNFGDSLINVKEDIMELENRWRARKRLDSLEEMGAFRIEIKDPLLSKDMLSLEDLYENGNFVKFFRVWERINGNMKALKIEIARSSIDLTDDGNQVLIRGRSNDKETKDSVKKNNKIEMAGISRLAKDMGEKRKMMDGLNRRPTNGKDTDDPDQLTGEAKDKGDLAGVAKLIAGDRIKKLEKEGSSSINDLKNGSNLPWSKDETMNVSGLSNMMDDMEDFESRGKDGGPKQKAEKAKERLERFYSKLPKSLPLDESISIYNRGITQMNRGDHNGALKEFRMAISSAIKITKLHTEIIKAIKVIDVELSNRRKLGRSETESEKLLIKAESSLRKGELTDCATLIKLIKEDLYNE